jgi:hypothetical protein
MLRDALARGGYDAVTVVHSETSTGALNPIRDLARVAHEAGDVVLLVDSVSGMCGADFRTDEWGVDFVLTGSQKSFALPPGLAFGVAQENILQRAEQKKDRGIYFDFLEFERNIQKNQTPNTPAVSLLYALAAQVEHMQAEGLRRAARAARRDGGADLEWCDGPRPGDPGGARLPLAHRDDDPLPCRLDRSVAGAAVKERGYQIATGLRPHEGRDVPHRPHGRPHHGALEGLLGCSRCGWICR